MNWKFWCTHKWGNIGCNRYRLKDSPNLIEQILLIAKRATDNTEFSKLIEGAIVGFETVVLQKCEHCGKLKTVKLEGLWNLSELNNLNAKC